MDAIALDILLVEDNPGDVFLINRILETSTLHYRLHHVEDGQAATEFLRHQGQYDQAPNPHLILLDLNLPLKDGRQILADIKSDPDLLHIPVIVLSTSSAPQDIEDSYQLQADFYLTKPLSLPELALKSQQIQDFWTNWQGPP
ncbi:MAG: response regulator [Acaryochloridaceae cyanobacterium SU_2_1]|nr:response regulator [Acaryochloridaceae cyanobacterium SU_2_1]NJM95258.1 response regulator [Acaryochloridaceae cyanobacterium CSU_5_19]